MKRAQQRNGNEGKIKEAENKGGKETGRERTMKG